MLTSNSLRITKILRKSFFLNQWAIKQLAKKSYYIAKTHYHYKLAHADSRFDKLPILVYQMGKVGSLTVTETLRNVITDRNIYHFHILRPERVAIYEKFRKSFFPDIVRGDLRYVWLCQYIYKRIMRDLGGTGKKLKIITLVRDPIAKSISDFFENSTFENITVGSVQKYKAKSEWYGYDIIINDMDFRELFQVFMEKSNHDRSLMYFDLEFKGVLGIDLYASDFPKTKGYKIYTENNADILLIKLEHLTLCAEKAFKQFLNIGKFDLLEKNISSSKEYANIYKRFKENACFSEPFLNKIYSSKLVRHFYSGDEIEKFMKKWSSIAT